MKVILAGTFLFASLASAQTGADRWIPTWVAAPQQPQQPRAAGRSGRAGAFSGAFNNQTARMVVHTSIGGHRVRIELSNAYGTAPLTVGAAHIALRVKDSSIAPDSDRVLLFNGKPSCSIPAGAFMISDPVDLEVPKEGDLAISVYVPGEAGPATLHSLGLHTTWISKSGDVTGQPEIADAFTTQSWYLLSGVEVLAPATSAAVVTFGDSITDGTRSTPNTDGSWPAFLAARLQANPATAQIAVLNQGISANRVLRDNVGTNALARFDRDVLSQPGVKWVTILEGINDIGAGIGPDFVFGPRPANTPASDIVTPDELIGAYKQIVERAHEHGIKVYGSPLMPFEGAPYYSESGNVTRQAVNQWIRTGGAFDAVIDFDAATRDTADPNHIRPEFDSGDHLHPNNTGYKAMAEAIDLSLFASGADKSAKQQKKKEAIAALHGEGPGLSEQFGQIDIYLFDQILRGRVAPGFRILDAGCGDGRNLVYLLRTASKERYELFGADSDPRAIAAVRRLAALLAPGLPSENFRLETIEQMSFPDAFADMVIGSTVLHFASSDEHFLAMLNGMWRVLKPGGLFFCRLASSIGIEHQIGRVAGRRCMLPDGSERYLVDERLLAELAERLGARLADPLKTTIVQNQRSMTTWVLRKNA